MSNNQKLPQILISEPVSATMISRAFELRKMRIFLAWSLFSIFYTLSSIIVAVLHFLLENADFLISDKHKSFLYYFFGLAAVAFLFAGPCISFLMISSYGPSIEKLITYVMDGNNTGEEEEEEESQSQKHHMWPVRSPNNKVGLDEPLLIPAGNKWKIAVNNGKKVTVCCAFTVIQIFVYLMGYLAGVELDREFGRVAGGFAVMGWSIFLASVFKLFSASHRYSFTMAKLVLAQSCVFEVVFVSFGGAREGSSLSLLYFMEMGCVAISILFVVRHVMRNPVDKLYIFNSPVTKKPTYCNKV